MVGLVLVMVVDGMVGRVFQVGLKRMRMRRGGLWRRLVVYGGGFCGGYGYGNGGGLGWIEKGKGGKWVWVLMNLE